MPTPLQWQLAEDADPEAPDVVGGSSSSAAAQAPLTFLGVGVLRPFRRDEKQDFANATDRTLLRARLGQVLGTKAQTSSSTGRVVPGELRWRGSFGSRLHILRHRNLNEGFLEMAEVLAREAIAAWEPNVDVTEVEEVNLGTPRSAFLRVHYVLVGSDELPDYVDVSLPETI